MTPPLSSACPATCQAHSTSAVPTHTSRGSLPPMPPHLLLSGGTKAGFGMSSDFRMSSEPENELGGGKRSLGAAGALHWGRLPPPASGDLQNRAPVSTEGRGGWAPSSGTSFLCSRSQKPCTRGPVGATWMWAEADRATRTCCLACYPGPAPLCSPAQSSNSSQAHLLFVPDPDSVYFFPFPLEP